MPYFVFLSVFLSVLSADDLNFVEVGSGGKDCLFDLFFKLREAKPV